MNLSKDSRIWIFQANRKFTTDEKIFIQSKLKSFLADWNAHGASLLADFELPYDQFIVVGVDENQANASGCSIDKLTKIMRELDTEFNFELLNRMLVAYQVNTGEILVEKLPIFKKKIKDGELSEINVFNNGISDLDTYKKSWVLPLNKSWANTLLN